MEKVYLWGGFVFTSLLEACIYASGKDAQPFVILPDGSYRVGDQEFFGLDAIRRWFEIQHVYKVFANLPERVTVDRNVFINHLFWLVDRGDITYTKIETIKLVRSVTSLGLKEAKELVEALIEERKAGG